MKLRDAIEKRKGDGCSLSLRLPALVCRLVRLRYRINLIIYCANVRLSCSRFNVDTNLPPL